jgi:hypothetical protein
MLQRNSKRTRRRGGVYIVVLGSAMIVSLLGLAALMGQRIQNRMLTTSADITQARLNANTAVESALLTMKNDANWRTSQPNGNWFTGRGTGAGTCTLSVTDPLDANLANDANEPFLIRGIGYRGKAEQRFEVTVDSRREPLSCLRSAVAATNIGLLSDTLRTDGLISANTVSATSAQVYGTVEAVTVSGSTYHGTATQIEAADRPAMPDWSTVFNYYRTNGTEINIASLPTTTPNLGRNVSIENGTTDWTGTPPGLSTATIKQSGNYWISGSNSLEVDILAGITSGAAQTIDHFVKPNQQYLVEAWVRLDDSVAKPFYITLHTKGTGGAAQVSLGVSVSLSSGTWTKLSATLTAPSWSGDLEYAFVKIGSPVANTVQKFYMDDLVIREATTGRFIYRQVLSPSLNPFGATTNAQGIYWINCAGNKLVIERSRIQGTLLVVNPGAGSCVADGPISWSPAVAGYPALLVDADTAGDADFAIHATNRVMSEKENATNFNPAGAAHDEFGQDADTNDIYESAILGLVAIEDDLTYQNQPLIRGQVIVGDNISNSSGELEVEFLPDALLNPPPGFFGPYSYVRRPSSARKAVLP